MRHLAIAAMLFLAACGGKSKKADTGAAPTPEAPVEGEAAPAGPEMSENERFGKLLLIEWVDDMLCLVTLQFPDGHDSVFVAHAEICENDYSEYFGSDAILTLDGYDAGSEVSAVTPVAAD